MQPSTRSPFITACVSIALGLVLVAPASASLLVSFQDVSVEPTNTTINGVTVAAGDLVVMAITSNKRDSTMDATFGSTEGSPFITLSADGILGTNPNPGGYLAYTTIGTGGTYDFYTDNIEDALTGQLGLYVVSSTLGGVTLIDSGAVEWDSPVGITTSVTNSLAWADDPSYGEVLLLSTLSSRFGNTTNTVMDAGYTDASGQKRALYTYSLADGATGFDVVWEVTSADATRNETGSSVTAAFAEIIPEPGTLSLAAFGAAAATFLRRRRRA
jgi:hypothetical protein